jgi:hypothetical protein
MDRGSLADLTAFVAVADRLSFRAAASQLGVTPSALSHSMRQLEERLTLLCLIHRSSRGRPKPPQGRDSQVSKALGGVFLWAQLTVPDHAEIALADGHDLGDAAIVDRP